MHNSPCKCEQLNIYMIAFIVFYTKKCFIPNSRVKVNNKTIGEDIHSDIFLFKLYNVPELTVFLLLFAPILKVPPFFLHDKSNVLYGFVRSPATIDSVFLIMQY